MLRFFIRRVLLAVLTLFAISATTFSLFFLGPNDPASSMCGVKVCTPAAHDRIVNQLGLNDPPLKQYGAFMRGIVFGRKVGKGELEINCHAPCLGVSFRTREPVLNILKRGLPISASIVLGGMAISFTVGVAAGIYTAIRRGTIFDKTVVSLSLGFSSMQIFFLGLVLQILLVYQFHVLPRPQWHSPVSEGIGAWASGMMLPWLTYGLISSATYARFGRNQMLETLSEDFIRTARAKGLTTRTVNARHALRAAITPLMTLGGLEIGGALGGVPITETTFNMLGVGRTSVKAVFDSNLPIIMATVLIAAVFVVAMNVLVDMMYAVIDPRVRLS